MMVSYFIIIKLYARIDTNIATQLSPKTQGHIKSMYPINLLQTSQPTTHAIISANSWVPVTPFGYILLVCTHVIHTRNP